MPNSVEYVLAFTGATGVGMTVTTFNPAYTAAEVSRQILTSKAKVMLTSGAFEKLVLDAIKLSGNYKGQGCLVSYWFFLNCFFFKVRPKSSKD